MEDRASQEVSVVKNLPASTGDATDAVSIPRSGRFLGVGIGVSPGVSPLQYSCLENPMGMTEHIRRKGWEEEMEDKV